MEISLGKGLNSLLVGDDLLEENMEISPKKDFNFSLVGENLLEKDGDKSREGLIALSCRWRSQKIKWK